MSGYQPAASNPTARATSTTSVSIPRNRGRESGRDLVVALDAWLMPAAPKLRVALSVDDDRNVARALYASLGFATRDLFVVFRPA